MYLLHNNRREIDSVYWIFSLDNVSLKKGMEKTMYMIQGIGRILEFSAATDVNL